MICVWMHRTILGTKLLPRSKFQKFKREHTNNLKHLRVNLKFQIKILFPAVWNFSPTSDVKTLGLFVARIHDRVLTPSWRICTGSKLHAENGGKSSCETTTLRCMHYNEEMEKIFVRKVCSLCENQLSALWDQSWSKNKDSSKPKNFTDTFLFCSELFFALWG